MKRSFVLGFLLFFGSSGFGRVFDFGQQTFSTYLRATGGPTTLGRSAYAPGLPTNVTFSDANSPTVQYSAEIGVAFTKPSLYTLRLGVEALYPFSSGGSTGTVGGVPQFNVTSQVYGVIPQANFEFFLKKKPNWRLYLGVGGGYAYTSISNSYTFTPQGSTTYGIPNYTESASSWAPMGQGYLGFEFPAFDNVGLSFDVGYRYLNVSSLTANQNYQSPLGTYPTGATVVNNNGSNRTLNLGGVFGALNFRFYFD